MNVFVSFRAGCDEKRLFLQYGSSYFSSRVERLRSLVSTQIHTDHVNAALGILEHDAAEKADDVIAFFKRYRESEYPVEALIQAYYYSADYLQWLEEIICNIRFPCRAAIKKKICPIMLII